MTIDEAIETVARSVLADHKPTERLQFRPLSLEEAVASAVVRGRAGELDPTYCHDADNWVIDILYADRGYGATYEVGPKTPPICWAD